MRGAPPHLRALAVWSRVFGYSRAVVVGGNVHVAGTAPIPREGEPPEGAYEQMRLCLEIVGEALGEGRRGLRGRRADADVHRRRRRTGRRSRARTARCSREIRPAATAVVVEGLLDPRWRVEIEAEAVLP